MDELVLKLILAALGTVTTALMTLAVWLWKDYYKFRTNEVPKFRTITDCNTCQTNCRMALDASLSKIDDRLQRGDVKFEKVAIMLARIGEKLGVEGHG